MNKIMVLNWRRPSKTSTFEAVQSAEYLSGARIYIFFEINISSFVTKVAYDK